MYVSNDKVRNLIEKLGFSMKNGIGEIWIKEYKQHNGYSIVINFDEESIDYVTNQEDNCVKVLNNTTTNFRAPENFVVLECIDRLLEKGYKPHSIELEHSWPSGHGTSGRLDIMVYKNETPYLMIECKTYGKEFDKEKNKMRSANKNGESKGQLFSYFAEERKTEYLCLYASGLEDNKIKLQQAIVPVEDKWRMMASKKEIFAYWNKTFKNNGIFEDYIKPYCVQCRALLRGDLEKLSNKDDSDSIFNQFLEILRHNAVSDKPNAFNKVLNLFICKIVDEEKRDNEELQFQWKDNSTYVSLQSNLEELYKKGMDKFLSIEVTDYSDAEIDKSLSFIDAKSKQVIRKMFRELRLQKNPEFAFKEVYNEESFNENAKVLKEIVELLQPYQFKYGHKQQFLGNFFEQLLNTSIKQESGQFFTPVPIARFMITSLPIKEVIDKNVEHDNKELLPTAVDYACGAGHFLTEYMDVVQEVINEYDTNNIRHNVKNKIEKWKQSDNESEPQGEFEWASDYVYGIEKDYRLVKTTKISTFLNGDGEANVIHADGLDKFSSAKYKGLLSSTSKTNHHFDFVIANPPYSVNAFKQTLPSDSSDFETYAALTDSSSEIECLFVERANQLLKENGCAAIILPSSIFSNTGNIYNKTREILLRNFRIKAIAKMGSNTFMATGTNTIILFIKKRPETDYAIISTLVDNFLTTAKDFTYNSIPNVIHKYVDECFDNIDIKDYLSFIKHSANDKFKQTKFYNALENAFRKSKEYVDTVKKKAFKQLSDKERKFEINKLFGTMIDKTERIKLEYFLLTCDSKTIIITTGDKQEEKDFLGYEFSNRRGYEGIHYYSDENDCINSRLYDEENLNGNECKVNYYIHKSFIDEFPDIPSELIERMRYVNSSALLTFDNVFFINTLVLNKKPKPVYNCDSMPLSTCIEIKIGGTPPRKNRAYFTGNNLWVSIAEMDGQVILDTKEKLTDIGVKESNVKLIKAGTTLLSFKLSVGKVAIAGKDLYTNEAIAALEIREEYKDSILDEYLFYLFKSKAVDIEGDTKAFGIVLNSTSLGEVVIPVPSIPEQKEFIGKFKKLDEQIDILDAKRQVEQNKRSDYITSLSSKGYNEIYLGNEDYIKMKRGPFGGDLKKEIFVSSGYKVYEQQHAIKNDFTIGRYYITKEKYNEMQSKGFDVVAGDIIMSCSGTIGKFALAPYDVKNGVINQALLKFRATDKVLPAYLKICLEDIVHNLKSHGLGLQNLSSVDSLKSIKTVVPNTIDEQQIVIKEVENFDRKINSCSKEIDDLRTQQAIIIKDYI